MVIQCEFETTDVRNLYDAVCDAVENWPGYPKRPVQQQEDYLRLKTFLFSMLCEMILRNE
jgi:hypothetical protein